MKSLSITNDKILREVTEEQMQRLKKYLYDLDLFVPDKTYVISPQYNSSPTCVEDKDCNICVQPGLRYNHAKTLVEILDYDTFIRSGNLNHQQKNELYTMFLNMSMGRILEEIIRNETREFLEKNQNYDVYKVEFNNNDSTPCGEYDMLIYDKSNNSCQIYEIKHSKHKSKRQGHWLKSTSLNYLTEYFFGKITKRAIIYMGDNDVGEKQYINANDYLQNIKDYIF